MYVRNLFITYNKKTYREMLIYRYEDHFYNILGKEEVLLSDIDSSIIIPFSNLTHKRKLFMLNAIRIYLKDRKSIVNTKDFYFGPVLQICGIDYSKRNKDIYETVISYNTLFRVKDAGKTFEDIVYCQEYPNINSEDIYGFEKTVDPKKLEPLNKHIECENELPKGLLLKKYYKIRTC